MRYILTVVILFIFVSVGAAKPRVLIGAYYFDGWAGQNSDPYMQRFNAPTHLNSKLLFKYGNREPIWGWRDDELDVMEKQIDVASSNGIDFFSFCWYWEKDKGIFDQNATEKNSLNHAIELFLRAKNKKKMKFSILVANHPGHEIVGKSNYESLMNYLGHKFFNDPQYLELDHKPVLTFFQSSPVAPYLPAMNAKLQKMGYKGLYSVGCASKDPAFSAHTWYNLKTSATARQTYQSLTEHAEEVWERYTQIPHVFPLVMVGWDKRPWDSKEQSPYYLEKTPALFEKHLNNAVRFIRKTRQPHPVIMIYAWNELGEGGYLVPTKEDPQGSYLKVIKRM